MKVDWFMIIVLAGVAPAGIIFVLLWWRTSGRWNSIKTQSPQSPAKEDKQVVVKNDSPPPQS